MRWVGVAAAASVMIAVGWVIIFQQTAVAHSDAGQIAKNIPKVDAFASKDPPFQVAFKELAQKPNQELLVKQIQKETAVHLEMTVGDNKAVAQLAGSFEKQGHPGDRGRSSTGQAQK